MKSLLSKSTFPNTANSVHLRMGSQFLCEGAEMKKNDEQVPDGLGSSNVGLDDDIDALSANMDVVHELSVSGASEWDILQLAAAVLSGSKGRLSGLTVTRFGEGNVALRLRVTGLPPARAREITHLLCSCDTIVRAKIEHMILKSRR